MNLKVREVKCNVWKDPMMGVPIVTKEGYVFHLWMYLAELII